MKLTYPFRAADIGDCHAIAQLFTIASDGVSNYIWSQMQSDYPGVSLVEIGAKRYASEEGLFTYRNCVIAERDRHVAGMMLTFPIESSADASVGVSVRASVESETSGMETLEILKTFPV